MFWTSRLILLQLRLRSGGNGQRIISRGAAKTAKDNDIPRKSVLDSRMVFIFLYILCS